MKVLLTGANGFVGSHVLDRLCALQIPTAILLRATSNPRFIERHLAQVEVRPGTLDQPPTLSHAMQDVTHVIHCAGLTRARRSEEFNESNYLGTRHIVTAVNQQGGRIQRLIYISSLAAHGPATRERPAREDDEPRPVSDYGKSKLAGEQEVMNNCQAEFVVLRPPAVYGPRDDGFIQLFATVKRHVIPKFLGGIQAMSFVFVKDLAEAVVTSLTHPAAAGKSFFVSSGEAVAPHDFARIVAAQLKVRAITLPLPTPLLWPVCAAQEAWARLTGRPTILNRQKYAELSAAGWVCDPTRSREELGIVCATPLNEGIAETAAWYQEQGWL